MDSQEVGGLLEECVRAAAAAQKSPQPSGTEKLNYCHCRDSLCKEVASLLQEAMDMKWPFVPEKWQYKLSPSAHDKTNLSDLISKHLLQLLAVLKASIMAQEAHTALAVVFLMDRFLYWTDESARLLKITKLLHICHPDIPVAPQLVIRQARVYLNSGKLQKAEYILSSLINNSGATGCWVYHSESDRTLVQAVSVQVRGMILQKLGLWLEAAHLIWASLVGYYSLPKPDKKGIGTSLGILANILVSMNDEDFCAFRTNPDIDFKSLLGDGHHRLLSAAQAAKMAVVYSQYTSLYVLTNAATQGTCLLSHSFSMECPDSQRQCFLLQAREAFSIGLLTKVVGEQVTSKQELHTFLKAAYSLTVTHKWLGTPPEVVAQATQACQRALAVFYDYCHADDQDKDGLCAVIMHLVAQVKLLLQVEPFLNSDKGSFIPDSYRNIEDTSVSFTVERFSRVMQRFQKYHASLCETTKSNCKGAKDKIDGARFCITALMTTIGTLSTQCNTEACKGAEVSDKNKKRDLYGCDSAVSSHAVPRSAVPATSSSSVSSDSEKFEMMQAETEVEDVCVTDAAGVAPKPSVAVGAPLSLSQLTLRTPSSSLSDSFSSQSSWEKMSTDLNSPTSKNLSKSGTSQNIILSKSERSKNHTSGWEFKVSPEHQPLECFNVNPNKDTEIDSASVKPAPKCSTHPDLFQCAPTETSTESSFEMLEENQSEHQNSEASSPAKIHSVSAKPAPRNSPHLNLSQCAPTETSTESSFEMLGENQSEHQSSEASSPAKIHSVSAKPAPKNSPHTDLSQCAPTETSSESSFEMLGENQSEHQRNEVDVPQTMNPLCYNCLKPSTVGGGVPKTQYWLSQKDYWSLLAGVCHHCLLKRLHSDTTQFKLKKHGTVHSALHLKFSKATGLWTARETCVYIGKKTGMEGQQRAAIWVQFLHQEERLSSYVGKDYREPKQIQFHLKDVERQMTAQYYVTEFNKSLYDKDIMAQIFFIPSEALLILNGNEIVGCVTVEPYMLGDFVKLTNNTDKTDKRFQATEYGLAFGHFTYQFSEYQEVVVDLQGWVTANGKGLTYLTDPQIHSTKTPRGPSNFAARGLRYFLEYQHGPDCNGICQVLNLRPVVRQLPVVL